MQLNCIFSNTKYQPIAMKTITNVRETAMWQITKSITRMLHATIKNT